MDSCQGPKVGFQQHQSPGATPGAFSARVERKPMEAGSPRRPSVQGILHLAAQAPLPNLQMMPVDDSSPRKCSVAPKLMEKGLMLLQSMAGRDNQVPEWKLRRRQRCLSKSAQAISHFYRQKGESKQDISPGDTSFMAELEELRKMFLSRPGCPQFSTKATSMSHYGESQPRGGPHVKTTSWPGGGAPFHLVRVPVSSTTCGRGVNPRP
uniref:Coiled-coil domain containing 27 n=1 Tax=Canis lupus dingo TaxID=286419 RepID=A0A8C0KAI1_CANLU